MISLAKLRQSSNFTYTVFTFVEYRDKLVRSWTKSLTFEPNIKMFQTRTFHDKVNLTQKMPRDL